MLASEQVDPGAYEISEVVIGLSRDGGVVLCHFYEILLIDL